MTDDKLDFCLCVCYWSHRVTTLFYIVVGFAGRSHVTLLYHLNEKKRAREGGEGREIGEDVGNERKKVALTLTHIVNWVSCTVLRIHVNALNVRPPIHSLQFPKKTVFCRLDLLVYLFQSQCWNEQNIHTDNYKLYLCITKIPHLSGSLCTSIAM